MNKLRLLLLAIVPLEFVTVTTNVVFCLQQPTTTTILVCQNKACCQRWKLKTPLPEVLFDLVHDATTANSNGSITTGRIVVDTASCLGQCDKGPNMRIKTTMDQPDVFFHGVNDPINLITQLDESLSITVSSKLLAAVNVFNNAQTVSTLDEKQRYTSSIIRVLDAADDLRMSTANARARIYQAELILESGNCQEAIDEVTRSIQLLSSIPSLEQTIFHTNLLGKAYRVAADAYERSGDFRAAMDSIRSMASTNPDMRVKVAKEIERLQQLAAA